MPEPQDLSPEGKSAGERPGSSVACPARSLRPRLKTSLPYPPPPSRVQQQGLATGCLCGPAVGWSQGQGSPGRGSALQEDSWPSGQWQFRKVNRPQRECCLFFGGGGHEAGPQPRGKSPELEKRGVRGGWREPDISYPLSRFRHNRKRGCGFPRARPPHHQVICAVPLRRLLLAAFESGSLPRRFDFWPSLSARLFLPLSSPSSCFPPSRLARAGWQSRGGAACRRLEIKSPPGIDISPQAGGGSCWGCFLFRGFVLFLFVSREFSFHNL